MAWLSITPLGRPVVPPVYITAARSVPLRIASGTGVAAATSAGPSSAPAGAGPLPQCISVARLLLSACSPAVVAWKCSSTSRSLVSQSSSE